MISRYRGGCAEPDHPRDGPTGGAPGVAGCEAILVSGCASSCDPWFPWRRQPSCAGEPAPAPSGQRRSQPRAARPDQAEWEARQFFREGGPCTVRVAWAGGRPLPPRAPGRYRATGDPALSGPGPGCAGPLPGGPGTLRHLPGLGTRGPSGPFDQVAAWIHLGAELEALQACRRSSFLRPGSRSSTTCAEWSSCAWSSGPGRR